MKRLQPFEIRPVHIDELPPLPQLTPERILQRTPPGRWRQRLLQVCILGAALAPSSVPAMDGGGEVAAADQSVADSIDVDEPQAVGCMCAPAPGSGLSLWAAGLLTLLVRRGRPKRD